MIVDSSVWIAHQRNTPLPQVAVLRQELQQGGEVLITPSILQEVLQGARNPEQLARWEKSFAVLPLVLPAKPAEAAVQAARLYAKARWQGLTVDSPNDVLVAVIAVEHDLPVLHADQDFQTLARIEPRLQLIPTVTRL